jgi:hypothetical protein
MHFKVSRLFKLFCQECPVSLGWLRVRPAIDPARSAGYMPNQWWPSGRPWNVRSRE